jgi:hypothetical protein
MPTKSFRGLIKAGSNDAISLHTNNGSTGYRIKKLQVIPELPGAIAAEFVCTVFTVEKETAPTNVDFSDNTLLATAFHRTTTATNSDDTAIIIFDNTTFNQDIYVYVRDATGGTGKLNYYIELEQFKLSLDENTVATLKDIRNIQGQ